MMKVGIIANITWNPDGWRNIYKSPLAGHRYARKFPGHESLNFKFDKPIDQNGKIHGYVQWTHPPKKNLAGGFVIFYSRNLIAKRGEIVGIYGNAEILQKPVKCHYPGFEEDILLAKIVADEDLSMLFPLPLDDKKYKQLLNVKRLVPQVGFRLIENLIVAKSIIHDEIVALRRSGIREAELKKLIDIFEYTTGEPYQLERDVFDQDLKEQEEIIDVLTKRKVIAKGKIAKDLKNLKPSDPEVVTFEGKRIKRDNKTIAELKILRDFECQICRNRIIKKNGDFYVEAAHITPKCKKGLETPENILILCPNHHKEFDLGKKEIISRSKGGICFKLNDKEYSIKLDF